MQELLMATSIQAPQRKQKPAASPSDSISNTTPTANSAQIKRVLKPTVRSASSDTNKVSSSDQNRHLPNYHKPTKRSPPHESFRYVKKDGQNERNSATQNHKAVVSSGPTREGTTRTARRTSLSPGAKTAASPSAKPGQERVSKASKPGKIHQLYVKKTTLLSNGKETHDPPASTEISKDVAVDPVSRADNQKTKQEETEVTIPTETVAETEKVLVDVSVSEEERKKLQISDISTVSEENQSSSAVEASESLAAKEDEMEHDGNSALRIEKEQKKEGQELEETKGGDKKDEMRVESEVEEIEKKEEEDENSTTEDGEERKGEDESMKMVKLGSSGKKESEVIEETASKVLEERKNKVKALVGAFESVIDYESSSK